ncbi:translation initiation factor IF-2-like [Sciurus carolinensis]|uniref:translation initiation factor IF-2-like n=1 Tax=Sciurus carolinensis TaxID=30640 RepID=UPI001FB30C3C|nr:translation initiation factor IF-2-like [Sciurus carolinensis]
MNENKRPGVGARAPPREAAAAFKVAAPSPASPAPRAQHPGRQGRGALRCAPTREALAAGAALRPAPLPGGVRPPAPVRPAPAAHSPRPERRRGPSPCGPARVPVRAEGGAASTAAERTRGHRQSRGAQARPCRPAERPAAPFRLPRAALPRPLPARVRPAAQLHPPGAPRLQPLPRTSLGSPFARALRASGTRAGRGEEVCARGAARLPRLPARPAGKGGFCREDPRRGRRWGRGFHPLSRGERSKSGCFSERGGWTSSRAGRSALPIPHAGQWTPRPGSRGPGRSDSPGQRSLPVLRPRGSTAKRLPQMITEKHVQVPF